jgi:hypothetical protein
VVGRRYLAQQAATLLKFARATTDPELAAGLIEKVVALQSQVQAIQRPDPSPQAPDVELE